MGGYGGSSGRVKDKCYYDTGGHKVKDKNSIEVAEYYINKGKRVAFLQEKPPEKRPDLLVDNNLLVEVKGISSTNPSQISKQLEKASKQIDKELSKYSADKKVGAKIIIVSRHSNFEDDYNAVCEGYKEAKRKGEVGFKVEFWHDGKIYILE